MDAGLLQAEATLPLCVLVLASGLAAALEGLAPRRDLRVSFHARWANNVALWLVHSLLAWSVFPVTTVAFAMVVAERGWGLFHLVSVPLPVAALLSVLALDLTRFGEHWLYHHVPVLWRLHRLHHTDIVFDFTVGLRFHPVEGPASTHDALAVVAALGAPPLAVLAYQLLATVSWLLTHGNIRVPPRASVILEHIVVTPDMHRIHHSAAIPETNSNLGNVFP